MQTKLPDTSTSIFSVMSSMAHEAGAINLSQGFPDFSPSTTLMRMVHDAMVDGHNQYAPMPGMIELRQTLSDKIYSLYGTRYDPETEITITAGATQAIYTAITCLVRKGDEVIVIEPYYDSYVPAIQLSGGVSKFVRLKAPYFSVNWDQIESRLNENTKLFIFNTPHNPAGTIWQQADLIRLQELSEKYNFYILSDEVYEHLVFDGKTHESIAKYEGLKNRTFATFSFGKVFHNTGWKTGYIIGPKHLMSEFRKIHQFVVFSSNTPIQYALNKFLKNQEEYLSLSHFFQKKRDILLEALADSSFDIIPSAGTYFQLLGYKNISDLSDMEFCKKLTYEHGIAAIPISAFYHDKHDEGYIRLCFAKSNQTLLDAAEKLRNL